VRVRSETFADHYSQARQFWRSMTDTEQRHIVNAYTFELSKVETIAIRTRMLGHLQIIDPELGDRVPDAMGMVGMADEITPAREPIDLDESPSLSLLAKFKPTLQGRKVGCLIGDGFDRGLVDKLRAAVKQGGRDVRAGRSEDRWRTRRRWHAGAGGSHDLGRPVRDLRCGLRRARCRGAVDVARRGCREGV
jgi:hypothetical protein